MNVNDLLEDNSIGYNNADCEKIDSNLEYIYNSTIKSIKNHIKHDIVDNVANKWFSEKAVEYFKKWQLYCLNASSDIRRVFQNYRDQMQRNIEDWRTRTNSTGNDLRNIELKELLIEISSVKATDDNGNRFITNTLENDLREWIIICRNNILGDIGDAISNVVIKGFIGENQNAAIKTAMESLPLIINGILNFLVIGDNSILNAITIFRNQYKQTGSNVANDALNAKFGDTNDGSSNTKNTAGFKMPTNMGQGLEEDTLNEQEKTNTNYIKLEDINKLPQYMGRGLEEEPKAGHMTPEEYNQWDHERYINMNDNERMIKRSAMRAGESFISTGESILDFVGTAVALLPFTGNEDVANMTATSLSDSYKEYYDSIYNVGTSIDKDGNIVYQNYENNNKIRNFVEGTAKNVSDLGTEYIALSSLEKIATTPNNLKKAKFAYKTISSIGEDGEKNLKSALENNTDIIKATSTSIVSGFSKSAVNAKADVLSDKFRGHIGIRAGINFGNAVVQQGIEYVDDNINGIEPKDIKRQAVGGVVKTGSSVIYDYIEIVDKSKHPAAIKGLKLFKNVINETSDDFIGGD